MPHKTDVSRLDHVIDEVSDPRYSQCELLREHLEAARAYVMGDMPVEYRLTLRLAMEALDCITDHADRHHIKDTLAGLLEGKS